MCIVAACLQGKINVGYHPMDIILLHDYRTEYEMALLFKREMKITMTSLGVKTKRCSPCLCCPNFGGPSCSSSCTADSVANYSLGILSLTKMGEAWYVNYSMDNQYNPENEYITVFKLEEISCRKKSLYLSMQMN